MPIHLQHAGAILLQLQMPQIVPEAICKTLLPKERLLNNPVPVLPIPGTPAEIRTILLPTGQRVQMRLQGQLPTELPAEVPAAGIILLRGKVIHQHTANQGPPISPAIIAAPAAGPAGAAVH